MMLRVLCHAAKTRTDCLILLWRYKVFTRRQFRAKVRIDMRKMHSLFPLQFILFISVSDLLMERSFDCLSIP